MTGKLPAAGRLLELWDKRELIPVMLLEPGEDGLRIRYLSPKGRKGKCAASRIAHDTGVDLDPVDAPETLAEKLRDWDRRASERAGKIDLALLWEVVSEETDEEHSLEELALLALDSEAPLERSALLRALLADPLYFDKGAEGWTARPAEKVEEARSRLEAEQRRERRLETLRAVLRDAARGAEVDEAFPEEHPDLVAALESLVLGGTPHPDAGLVQKALPVSGRADAATQREAAFHALVGLGIYSEDEDLGRRRLGIPRTFPPEVERAARSAARAGPGESARRDLRELELLAVDQASTREVDDAVGVVEDLGGAWKIAVAVADPAAFVRPGDPVDVEALRRTTAHYLPSGEIPMLPACLAHEAASLADGRERSAVVFLCTVDEQGVLQEAEACLARVRDTRRLTYEEASRKIEEGAEPLATLHEIARRRVRWRHAQGAVVMRQPEVEVEVRDGEPRVTLTDPGSPSRLAISELMILSGEAAAQLLHEQGVPTLYRRQPPPDDLPSIAGEPEMLERPYDPVLLRAIRRRMRPSEVGVQPGRHSGLGLDLYTQVTSPLRRYQDLAMHRQLRGLLEEGGPPYDEDELQRIAAATEEAEREARAAERESQRYWLLRHLEEHIGGGVEAVILQVGGRRTLVELVPYLVGCPIDPREEHEEGAVVDVRIVEVDARRGVVRVEEVLG